MVTAVEINEKRHRFSAELAVVCRSDRILIPAVVFESLLIQVEGHVARCVARGRKRAALRTRRATALQDQELAQED
jgi:hypothetical protein